MRALVLDDGNSHTAMCGAHALARAGWQIGSGSPHPSLVAHAHFAQRWHRVQPPHLDFDRFVEQVASATEKSGYDIVFPTSDAEVLALSAARKRISAIVPYPPDWVVQRAFDKLELVQAASRVGIRVPCTALASPDSWQTVKVPVVVKCRVHWTPWRPGLLPHNAPSVCWTREEVRLAVDQMVAVGVVPLVQEYLPGEIEGIALVMDRTGQVLGAGQMVADRLLRGANVRATTTEPDHETIDRLALLLRHLGWSGLAHFDLVRDAATGDLLPIDLNGRWFMSMAAFDAAGLDLASLWAGVATGVDQAPAPNALPGVRFQWLEAELLLGVHDRSVRELLSAVLCQRRSTHPYWVPGGRTAALRYDLHRIITEARDAITSRT